MPISSVCTPIPTVYARIPSVGVLSDIAYEEGREFDPADMPRPADIDRLRSASLHEALFELDPWEEMRPPHGTVFV
jgi:hypothetical protein